MLIYLSCFAVSTLFAFFAQNCKSKKKIVFYSFLSICVMALLAGLRDITIGIDTSNTYNNTWSVAIRSRSFLHFMELYHKYFRTKEYLYAALIGGSAKVFGDYHVFLTLVHLIIVGCVYIGAFRLREYVSPPFVLLIFYLLYFNHSLNIMRQYMAMAILFVGVKDILDNRHLRFCIIVLIATMFHNTAAFGLLYLVLYRLLYPRGKMRVISLTRRMALFVFILIGVFSFMPIARFLIQAGVLNHKYLYYVVGESTNTYLVARVLVAFEMLVLLLFLRSILKSDSSSHFFIFCTFIFVILYQIAPSLPYGKRIPAYFSIINISTIGHIIAKLRQRNNRIIVRGMVIIISFMYWLVMYGYYNASRTVPYLLGV